MAFKTGVLNIALVLLLTCFGCGKAVSTSPNDAAPVGGTIVATGAFSGAVTGTVSVYSMGSNSYIIRLVGLSAPAEAGIQMIPWVNSAAATTFTLRAATGNQNYNLTASGTLVWNKIVIRSSSQARDLDEAPLR